MSAPRELDDLVRRFERNVTSYRSGAYNEAQVRVEFLDPMFGLLGWDMNNQQGHAEAYKDVIHEDAIQIGGTTKAPDYCFRIGGTRKFFLEAKKPSVSIKDEPNPAYQLRRYAWSAKLPLSLLSDFQELAVYDCRVKPEKNDRPAIARLNYFTCDQYTEHWDEIAGVFSKDAVLKGSFDRFAVATRGKKGTAAVDAAFLSEIERWRDLLARNIAIRNPRLSIRELNEAVQRTIDRIIFLRICEDRGIETESQWQLRALENGANVYQRLFQLFGRADARYNSGLFHFQAEPGFAESPDVLTPGLVIDDKVLKEIIGNLYYPESPYEFSVLPADILGQVYEQFLGKVIRLTAGHQAKVEDKPEVKKAGGVYYTPTYIVDYIVEHTVGELLKGITPKQAVDLKVLDPACGSGSFLLGAYQRLLDWHRDWYVADGPEKHTKARKGSQPALYQAAGGEWRLTTAERKSILLHSIFGVDIDPQAVEVTKLSLLLKVLEGESEQGVNQNLKLFHERALPDLANNIKCGNSLIGSDYYHDRQRELFDEDEALRVNAFDWEISFPTIFNRESPGFDAVVGNPPYGSVLTEDEKDYIRTTFRCQSYQLDSYLLFLERSLKKLLRQSGRYGMIIPNPWLTNLFQEDTRRFVIESCRVTEIVHFRYPVFSKATVDTEIVLLRKAPPAGSEVLITVAASPADISPGTPGPSGRQLRHRQERWLARAGGVINIFLTEREERLMAKLAAGSTRLDRLCNINVGIKPYQVGKGTPPQTRTVVDTRPFDSDRRAGTSYRPYLRGTDIARYRIAPVEPRFMKYGPWLAEPRPAADFDAPVKLVMRQTGDSLVAALDRDRYLCLNNMHVLVPFAAFPAPAFILGVVNSRLMNWYYQGLNPEAGEALAEVKKTNVAALPIRIPEGERRVAARSHNRMVVTVDRMLALTTKHGVARTDHEKTVLQRQIAAIDREIDALVYNLYGLTDEEIKIVEQTNS